jgi:hypothetical protein
MIPDVLFQRKQLKLAAATGFTGAAPQTVNGNAVTMNDVLFGTLSARCTVLGDTNTITITAKWQVLDQSGTWVDVLNEPQNPAGVALCTGTAGADAATVRVIPAPTAVYAFRQARIVFTTGVGVGGGAGVDEVTSQEYYWVRPSF